MNLCLFSVVLVATVLLQASAFSPISQSSTSCRAPTPSALLSAHHYNNEPQKNNGLSTIVSGLALAGTIFAGSLLVAPEPSHAASSYDISTGAVVINTSTKPGQSLLKAEVDAKDLIGSVFKNRKALKQSVERISSVVKEELQGPAWSDIVRQVLQTERDVAPDITVNPPSDFQQLAKDLASGRLNLIVNGELINLSIDETSTKDTDELVIRAKGVKASNIKVLQPAQMAAKTRLEEQIEGIESFWNGPFTLIKLPDSFGKPTNGVVFGGSTFGIVVGSYALSYAYYLKQQDDAAKAAEQKRQQMAAKKAAAAAKAKAAKVEDEE